MRYYRLEITNKDGSTPLATDGTLIGPFDSIDSPGSALHIEFDVLITGYDVANSGTLISLYGVPVTMLRQGTVLSGCHLGLYAGFSDGLPLANPDQSGLIINGDVYSAYANWIGTHQSLNFVVNPSPQKNSSGQISSITFDGKKGERLGEALQRALSQSFQGVSIHINISDRLVLPEDSPGVYTNLAQLASTIKNWSIFIINTPNYMGVQFVMQKDQILIFDNKNSTDTGIQILPQELLGQPTWVNAFKVSFKCPLRSDIRNGDYVILPEGLISGPGALLAVNSPGTFPMLRSDINFSGRFLVSSVRHVGQFLNPDSSSAWVTIFEAYVLQEAAA